MKVIEHLENNKDKKTLISFEILPPLKGKSIQSIYRILDNLMEYKPPFINVTYHRAEYAFKARRDGFYEKVSIRKRPGTVGICAAIQYKYGVDAVPHLVCGGFSKMETEDALVDLNYLGIKNVLLLQGDATKPDKFFVPEPDGNKRAVDLVSQTIKLNQGIYLEEDLQGGVKTDFCIGVAGYPEKHFASPNFQADLRYLKEKVDAGASYIVTQMFFDNQKYFDFVKQCRAIGITVPIIPGLKPITRQYQLFKLPTLFHMSIPEELLKEMIKCGNDKKAIRQAGMEWTIKQCKELIAFGVPCIHFYTMSTSRPFQEIMKAIW